MSPGQFCYSFHLATRPVIIFPWPKPDIIGKFAPTQLQHMLNRKEPPKKHEISRLHLPKPQKITLDNGIPVYLVEMGTQEVLKLQVIFRAGRPFEHKRMVARATSRMLKEGTTNYSSAAIAEEIDYYGGTLSIPINLDTPSLILYSLTRHFEKLLPLVAEMLSQPSFPQEELQTFIDNNIQNIQVELTKNDVVAYRTITEMFFGPNHPYGYNSVPDDYRALTREDLIEHFQTHYNSSNCLILLSGHTGTDTLELLNKYLGQVIAPGKASVPHIPPIDQQPTKLKIDRPGTVQTAIRIGRRLFTKSHPDYQGFYILNTILGGYFGSRLMTNIREEKGYTYNIFSAVDSMHYNGCFYIGTEVSNDFVEPTLKEIYAELERLREELVGDDEMLMLRNYLLGSLLTMLDGAFNVADIIKTTIIGNLAEDDFDNLVNHIKTISPEEIRTLAQKYLQPEDLWQVVVGS